MEIPTRPGVKGFIKSTPRLTRTDSGKARFFAYAGVPDADYDAQQQTYIEKEPQELQLVMFGASAERAFNNFRKGDDFLAHGKFHSWTPQDGGEEQMQFTASDIGHNNNITNYTVERKSAERQIEAEGVARDSAGVEQAAQAGPGAAAGAVPVPGAAVAEGPATAVTGEGQQAQPGVQAQVAEVLAQREAQVADAPASTPAAAPANHEAVGR